MLNTPYDPKQEREIAVNQFSGFLARMSKQGLIDFAIFSSRLNVPGAELDTMSRDTLVGKIMAAEYPPLEGA